MNKTIFNTDQTRLTVKRTFAAPLALVWKAWTSSAMLDQWWAPKPWKSETKKMDFQEGGYRLYAMVSPEGEKHWGRMDFETITSQKEFTGKDSFCDENGVTDVSLPLAKLSVKFNDRSEQCEVSMITDYPSEEELQKIMEMGMEEGLKMAFENLDMVLSKANKTL